MSKILLQVIDVDKPNDDPLFMEPGELNVLLGSEGGERYTDLRVLSTVMIEETSRPIGAIAGFVGNSVRYEVLYHVPVKIGSKTKNLTWREFSGIMDNGWIDSFDGQNTPILLDENGFTDNIFRASDNTQPANQSFVSKITAFLKKFAQRIFM